MEMPEGTQVFSVPETASLPQEEPKSRLFSDRETLRLASNDIINFFGDSWVPIAWGVFMARFMASTVFVRMSPDRVVICLLLQITLCAWWLIDNLDQESRISTILIGIYLFAFYPIESPISWLPPSGFWLYYLLSMRVT